MKVIVNCDEPNCPKRWDALDGCGESHLSFCSECFRKVQLVDTHEAVHGVHQLGQIAATEESLAKAFHKKHC